MITHDSKRRRIAVALSGGVDSSVAAALLVQGGDQVCGITMRLWTAPREAVAGDGSDASSATVEDARQVCTLLGIPFHVVDLADEFKAKVVDAFCNSYALARTPNPCLICNREIKFKAFLRAAFDLGADYLATGHYARIRAQDGQHQLWRGVDREKDQSYALYMLGQAELAHVLFPLGEYTKGQVRALAERLLLPTARKAESQDICFLSKVDYRAFLARERPETVRPGPILDVQGRVIGEHLGLAFYTIGQRQGMGIAAAHPLYVVAMDSARNALIVGPRAALLRRQLLAEEVSFVSGHPPAQPIAVTAKVRYKAEEAPATLIPLPEGKARVVFAEPQPAITPGQGVVFYQGDLVLGGGIIASSEPNGGTA